MSRAAGNSPPLVLGNFQSNQYRMLFRRNNRKGDSRAPLLPEPNGMSWKSWPLKSMELSSNLSGRNSSGLSHTLGSLCMENALTITRGDIVASQFYVRG
ncbi:hypothetical protein ACFXTO_039345 [Malus domestica]